MAVNQPPVRQILRHAHVQPDAVLTRMAVDGVDGLHRFGGQNPVGFRGAIPCQRDSELGQILGGDDQIPVPKQVHLPQRNGIVGALHPLPVRHVRASGGGDGGRVLDFGAQIACVHPQRRELLPGVVVEPLAGHPLDDPALHGGPHVAVAEAFSRPAPGEAPAAPQHGGQRLIGGIPRVFVIGGPADDAGRVGHQHPGGDYRVRVFRRPDSHPHVGGNILVDVQPPLFLQLHGQDAGDGLGYRCNPVFGVRVDQPGLFRVHVPVVKGEYNLLVPECHQGQPSHAAGFHGRPQLRLD